MQHVQFDSFGEPIPQRITHETATPRAGSRVALAAGMGVFWSLVVVIVLARAFYFDPDFASKFQQVAEFARSVWATLGV